VVGVDRVDSYYGLDFDAVIGHYNKELSHHLASCDILISCVDTRGARATMRDMIRDGEGPRDYWLDVGNESDFGQAILGEVAQHGRDPLTRLPFVDGPVSRRGGHDRRTS
jgi:hypothetical protein